jgi:hypothetical protein
MKQMTRTTIPITEIAIVVVSARRGWRLSMDLARFTDGNGRGRPARPARSVRSVRSVRPIGMPTV